MYNEGEHGMSNPYVARQEYLNAMSNNNSTKVPAHFPNAMFRVETNSLPPGVGAMNSACANGQLPKNLDGICPSVYPGSHFGQPYEMSMTYQQNVSQPQRVPHQALALEGVQYGQQLRQHHEGFTQPRQYPGGKASRGNHQNTKNHQRNANGSGHRVGGNNSKMCNGEGSRHGIRGHAYRKLWQQVTAVNRGGRLVGGENSCEATVEELLETVRYLPPESSAVQAVAQGLHSLDSGALAALLKELNKMGHSRRAQEIFDWLRSLDSSDELYGLCNTMTYTTMISQCGSQQALRRALELIAEMRGRGIHCNVHTYSALMNVCIKSNELDLALDVYRQMLSEGVSPNLVTYNTLIDVYGKTGRWEEAISVLDALEQQGIEPEVRTYNTVIIACNQSSRAYEALQIYERMLAAGSQPTATTYTALISAYGKSGQLDSALEIFKDMVQRGCERNVITYSSLISACEKAGRWELALELFREMHLEGCRPNVVTYNSLIAACAQGAQWEKAQDLFEQMQKKGCRPDSVTFGGLISAFDRAGQWRRALMIFDDMKSFNCRADTVVYNTIIGALWKTGILWAQARAIQIFHAACRNGHFRLSIHTGGTQSPPFTGKMEYSPNGSDKQTPNGSLELERSLSLPLSSFSNSHPSYPENAHADGKEATPLNRSESSSLSGTQGTISSISDKVVGLSGGCGTPDAANGSPNIQTLQVLAETAIPHDQNKEISMAKSNELSSMINQNSNEESQEYTVPNFSELSLENHAQTSNCIEFGMHAFTVGSAVLSLLRWISELRDRLPGDSAGVDPHQTVTLVLNKGKPSREHTYPDIRAALISLLSTWSTPFVLSDVSQGCRIEARTKDVLEWLRTPMADQALLPFTSILADSFNLSQRDAAFQNDVLIEQRCSEAFSAIRCFEAAGFQVLRDSGKRLDTSGEDRDQNSNLSATVRNDKEKSALKEKVREVHLDNPFILQRSDWFRTASMLSTAFGFPDEALYDGFLLADRTLAALISQGTPLEVSITALIVACLMMAAEQAGQCTSFNFESMTERATGLQTGDIARASIFINKLLKGDTSSISSLRVLKLYLERLGAEFGEYSQTLWSAAGTSLELLPKAVSHESFRGEEPSVVAAASLIAGRKAAGLSPFWPTSLQSLTGLNGKNSDGSESSVCKIADKIFSISSSIE